MTEMLLTYALGRGLEHYDMPVVRSIVQEAAAAKLSFFVAGARHREERAVSDEKSEEGETAGMKVRSEFEDLRI